jgi:hypothetical protein
MRTRRGSDVVVDNSSSVEPMKPIELANDKASGPTSLMVTWGRETHQPMKFHSLEIGPYQMTVTVGEGESVRQAADNALAAMELIARSELDRKIKLFLGRARLINSVVVEGSDRDERT